jgi:hypothetical protein
MYLAIAFPNFVQIFTSFATRHFFHIRHGWSPEAFNFELRRENRVKSKENVTESGWWVQMKMLL